MYDLIDQPVARLSPSARLALWSIRGWLSAAAAGNCPPAAVAPALAQHGVLAALPHFHQLLCALNRGAVRSISLAPPACRVVGDDEAVLLGVLRNATAAPPVARATLAMLLDEKSAEQAFVAVLALTAIFHETGLEPIGPAAASSPSGR